MRTCSVPTCTLTTRAKGYCAAHYQRFLKYGDPGTAPVQARVSSVGTCTLDACDCPRYQGGLCVHHYENRRLRGDALSAGPGKGRRPKKHGPECTVEGCGRPSNGYRGMCTMHYARDRKTGDPGTSARFKAPAGAGTLSNEGYRMVSVGGKQVLEHRRVMEQAIGRRLRPEESVHHVNGQRADNRIDNLELWSKSHPSGQRVADKIAWAKEFLAQYPEETNGL